MLYPCSYDPPPQVQADVDTKTMAMVKDALAEGEAAARDAALALIDEGQDSLREDFQSRIREGEEKTREALRAQIRELSAEMQGLAGEVDRARQVAEAAREGLLAVGNQVGGVAEEV
jgi:hypothetical protein